MRFCISYTHPYPIKFLTHTLSLEYASCVFKLICRLQAHFGPTQNRRNYQSTDLGSDGPKVMQEPNSNESRQANPNVDHTRRPNTACQKKLGAVGGLGRPTDLPGRPTWPVGPTASTSPRVIAPWLPAINTRGVENTHTHTPLTSPLLHSLHSL